MYTPDGIVIVIRILYYLSEVVVLKLAGAVLYLECRLLDMCTGAPDSGIHLNQHSPGRISGGRY